MVSKLKNEWSAIGIQSAVVSIGVRVSGEMIEGADIWVWPWMLTILTKRKTLGLIEETPNILQVPSQVSKKVGKMWSPRLFCGPVITCSRSQGLTVPESQDPRSKSSSPSHIIQQKSLPPMEVRSIITMGLLLSIPMVLFLNATVPFTML